MCGRYSLDASIHQLAERYKAIRPLEDFKGKEEVFPTNLVPVVLKDKEREIRFMKWGFSPKFTNRPIINARAETVHIKPLFKSSFYHRRCIIPVTSFFEWKNEKGKKFKKRIHLPHQEIFSLAGLYSVFPDKAGNKLATFTIITTEANESMRDIHHRMPVIIPQDLEEVWLDNSTIKMDMLRSILKPTKEQLIIVDSL